MLSEHATAADKIAKTRPQERHRTKWSDNIQNDC